MKTRPPRTKRPSPDAAPSSAAAPRARAGHPPDPALLRRLARIEGQVRGLGAMIEERRYCIDILTQLAAVQQALRGVGRGLLERHMRSCVTEALTGGRPAEAERVSRELGALLDRWNR